MSGHPLRGTASTARRIAAGVLLAGAFQGACAAEAPEDGPPPGWFGPPPGWSGGVLVGAVLHPDFQGSRTSRAEPALGGIVTYRSDNVGVLEAGSRGATWTFLLHQDAALALRLGLDPGRIDSGQRRLTPFGERPGSQRLQGMGDVDMTPVVSLAGSLTAGGVPLTATLRQATASYAGAMLELGANLPFEPLRHVKLSVAPTLSFADRRTMQAYFGVTEAQALAAHRTAFDTHAGLQSAQLAIDLDVALAPHWHLDATCQARHLLGDAADSPVTEQRRQASGMLALVYQFSP